MPCQKKKATPPTCMTPSRRVLDSLTISDIPQGRVIYLPCSLTPSPSESQVCLCNDASCGPGTCSTPKKPSAPQARKCKQQKKPKPNCGQEYVGTNGITINDMPCCQELLRKLAQEALAYNPDCSDVDRRVCIQDPEDETSGMDPSCCVAIKPEHSFSTCPFKSKPTLKTPNRSCTVVPKINPCANIPNHDVEPTKLPCSTQIKTTCSVNKPICRKDDGNCSVTSCTRGVSSKEKQLRAKPPIIAPIPCRNTSDSIASNSSQILLAQLSKKNCDCGSDINIKKKDCHCSKTSIKQEMEKGKKKLSKQSKIDVVASKCSRKKCSVNTCPCRFPPAYSQYYDCTGQISGNCQCGRNN